MRIDWWTLALQAVNFLVLVWLLQRFLYRPVQAILARRREAAEKVFHEAATAKQQAEDERHSFESKEAGLTGEREAMLKEARAQIESERKESLAHAREKADELLAAAKAKIAEERKAAAQQVRGAASDLAIAIAKKLVSASGAPPATGAVLDRICGHLDGLPAHDLASLRGQLEDGTALEVTTAAPLVADEQKHWRETLTKRMGPGAKIEFGIDPSLISGAELHFPTAVLRFSWREALDAARRELTRDADAE
ncbi:MAG: F0F1 ATP synthase subunit delta [Alphaproteobacteria bacterium]